MRLSAAGFDPQPPEDLAGEQRCLNSELWHACAGPLVSLPTVGSHVVYFPQGHSEQVAATTNKLVDAQIPSYPSLPPQLICQLHNVTMHADVETDEVYAQMTLQPLSPEQKLPYIPADLGAPNRQPTNYFCKTLTASDTSTHGGFSVPRRSAEKVFPPLDFSQQPPCQELVARDLHENEWKFRHIFRGQPKRHLLTTGWSVFVSAKRLVAGDSVLFIWNEKNQLLLGVRHATRPQTAMPSSVLSSDSMHLGLLAAAAHAAATNSRFTVFYNPRACPSEFVIPLSKYVKAVYHTRVSVGMRFRMLFETEESSVRRYMGTITGIGDLDPVRWGNSHWRSVKVGWDESTAGERQPRVSLWEIEPLTTFPMYPSPFPFRLKRPWPVGLPTIHGIKDDELGMNSPFTWLRGDNGIPSLNYPGLGVTPWMPARLDASMLGLQTDLYQAMAATVDPSKQPPPPLLQFQHPKNLPNRSAALTQSQPTFFQGVHENRDQAQSLAMCQTQQPLLQPQLHSFVNSNGNVAAPQLQVPLMEHQFAAPLSSSLQTMSSLCRQQSFSDSAANPVTSLYSSFPLEEPSHLMNSSATNPSMASPGWMPKQAVGEPLLPPMEQLGPSQTGVPHISASLPPFPSSIDPEGSGDPQSHPLLFGVNIDPSSLLLQNGMTGFKGVGTFQSSNYMSNMGSDFSLSPAAAPSSCVDELGFLHSSETVGQGQLNPPKRTFVKVYKMGSYGRSLDVTKFGSYRELRGELGRMFGLEGQLEDTSRSGWQLVFEDRENDTLLLGDGPWPEFVNSVSCIRILAPHEVLQMGEGGLELPKMGTRPEAVRQQMSM